MKNGKIFVLQRIKNLVGLTPGQSCPKVIYIIVEARSYEFLSFFKGEERISLIYRCAG
jgi:hypothetical protein